jgi:CheY-like chemotaxis protein
MVADRTILVADDNDDVRELVMLVLARVAVVVEAADGDRALVLARHLRPDLVVLDVQMPGPDGIDVCRALKADPRTAAMPVVLLTARDAPAVRARARAAGADAYVTKPFRPTAFLALVRELLPP